MPVTAALEAIQVGPEWAGDLAPLLALLAFLALTFTLYIVVHRGGAAARRAGDTPSEWGDPTGGDVARVSYRDERCFAVVFVPRPPTSPQRSFRRSVEKKV